MTTKPKIGASRYTYAVISPVEAFHGMLLTIRADTRKEADERANQDAAELSGRARFVRRV